MYKSTQMPLDFRAPVVMLLRPDPETVRFWRETMTRDEYAAALANFSKRMQE